MTVSQIVSEIVAPATFAAQFDVIAVPVILAAALMFVLIMYSVSRNLFVAVYNAMRDVLKAVLGFGALGVIVVTGAYLSGIVQNLFM